MGKTEDRRSKRSKRQKPARFASPTAASLSPTPDNCDAEAVEVVVETSSEPAAAAVDQAVAVSGQKIRPASSTKSTVLTTPPSSAAKKASSRKRRNSDTSSDEERWLNAIETGKLEEVDDELKKIKDPKLMTARQRAMYERTQDTEPALAGFVEELISLPSGYREKEKPQTAEDIQKAALKSQKRKQQADERREKDKQKTMERLLKKQETGKQRSAAARNKLNQNNTLPPLTYVNTMHGVYILVPPGQEFPLQPQSPIKPPEQKLCGIPGCGNLKKYNCSKTNVPLCSLTCYKKNQALSSNKDQLETSKK